MDGETTEDVVANATPKELIGLLYDRAVRDLRGAAELFTLTGDPRSQDDAIHLIVHAQQVVAELNHSLNLEDGNEVAKNLARLYEYMQFRLTESVANRQQAPVVEVAELLAKIGEAWKSVPENAALERQPELH